MFTVAEIPSYIGWLLPVLVIGIVVQFFWQSFNSWVLYTIAKKDRTIEGVETRLHDTTTKLIDERFRAMTHSIGNHVQGFTSTLDRMSKELQKREDEIDGLDDDGRDLERRMTEKMGQQHESIHKRISDLERAVMTRDDLKAVLREMRHES